MGIFGSLFSEFWVDDPSDSDAEPAKYLIETENADEIDWNKEIASHYEQAHSEDSDHQVSRYSRSWFGDIWGGSE